MKKPHSSQDEFIVISHRGASAYAPENTLMAIEHAVKLKSTWVEFDVQLSSDDVLFLLHDDTLERTSSGSGNAYEQPWSILSQLDAGAWFDSRFTNLAEARLPKLNQVLSYLKGQQIAAIVEIKPPQTSASESDSSHYISRLCQEIVKTLSDLQSLPHAMISCSELQVHAELRELEIPLPRAIVHDSWDESVLHQVIKLGCTGLHANASLWSPERLAQARELGFSQCLAYTVNDPAQAKDLQRLGLDGVFSDKPDLLS